MLRCSAVMLLVWTRFKLTTSFLLKFDFYKGAFSIPSHRAFNHKFLTFSVQSTHHPGVSMSFIARRHQDMTTRQKKHKLGGPRSCPHREFWDPRLAEMHFLAIWSTKSVWLLKLFTEDHCIVNYTFCCSFTENIHSFVSKFVSLWLIYSH